MPNGFGRGRGFGSGFRGGMGFGFRGSSPPWPYIGIGRGGLPRCEYFLSGAGAPSAWPHEPPPSYGYSQTYEYGPPAGSLTREDELDYLKNQAEAIKSELDQIESKLRGLESK
jgi:hypothetical protein